VLSGARCVLGGHLVCALNVCAEHMRRMCALGGRWADAGCTR
jgi:hypothetical protein